MGKYTILGIDPGTQIMGYGLIKVNKVNAPDVLDIGFFSYKRQGDHFERLKKIFDDTVRLIDRYKPDEMAIESPFYGKNIQSMLTLGRAQGVAISAALFRNIPIFEYAPRKIKMSITGNGGASKSQVAVLLQKILKIEELPDNLDATDGLAVALCHYYQRMSVFSGFESKSKSWEDFVKKNRGRISEY